MKKITLLFISLFTISNYAAIVEKNIPDYTFAAFGSLNFDFNSDGTNEFTFDNLGGVGCFFNPTDVNFVGSGSLASGHGWDVMKALPFNTLIGNTSVFDAQGDAYINPGWANGNEFFPSGDSYVGVKFKLGANVHYGWILINSTGGANGTITVKSYAYETVANQSINAGQVLSNLTFNNFKAKVFPNPSSEFVQIVSDKNIISAIAIDVTGKTTHLNLNNNSVIISGLTPGLYMLQLITDTNDSYVEKIVKN
jgi:hypothetical protein